MKIRRAAEQFAIAVTAIVVGTVGCRFDEVNLAGKACPCAPGWVCSPEEMCVERLEDAGIDASLDAATRDTTACDDAHADALFCDGFEDPNLLPWVLTKVDGTLEPATNPLFRGQASLKARMDAVSGSASAERFLQTPISSGMIHVRGYYYIPSGTFDYVQLLKFLENEGLFLGITVAIGGGTVAVLETLGTEQLTSSGAFPLDKWFCLQLNVAIDAAAGSVELLVDGAQVLNQTGLPTLPDAGYVLFGVGAVFTTPVQPLTTVFVDEVVLDTSPVACESN